MSSVLSAAPKVVDRGIRDNSAKAQVRQATPIPIHLPWFYIFAAKGDNVKRRVTTGRAKNIYGKDTFDQGKPFFNVSTFFAQGALTKQIVGLKRVMPSDIPNEANVTWSLEVLPVNVPLYQRGLDGKYIYDNTGALIPTGSNTTGYKVRWLVSSLDTATNAPNMSVRERFGTLATEQGTLTNGGVTSTVYPILQQMVAYKGSAGSNVGSRIWSPIQGQGVGVSKAILSKLKAYPFAYSVVERDDASSSPVYVSNVDGENINTFVLRPNSTDPNYKNRIHASDVMVKKYQLINDPNVEDQYADIGSAYIYQTNVDLLVKLFTDAEMAAGAGESWYDWQDGDTSEAAKYLFNIFGLTTSTGVPYQSVVFDSTTTTQVEVIRPSMNTTVYCRGGGDGTLSFDQFNAAVATELAAYGDPNSSVLDPARNPENIFYDVGFSNVVKTAMPNLLAVRRTIIAVPATYIFNQPALTLGEEQSQAASLLALFQAYPDSTYFGTSCSRATLTGLSGVPLSTDWENRMPLNYDLMMWACEHLGAANGYPNTVTRPMGDGQPGSVVKTMKEISGGDIPVSTQERLWSLNANYVLPEDDGMAYWPAVQTVYPDDTSALNSFRLSICLAYAGNKQYALQRSISGVEKKTKAEIIERSNKELDAALVGVNQIYYMKADTSISGEDAQRGFSITNRVIVGADPATTVMIAYIDVYRTSDVPSVN